MRIKTISVQEVEYIAHKLAIKFMEWKEPIPSFESRFPNILESCINTPNLTYEKKCLYKGLFKKASIQFYLMVKNHPFQNGNKRIAVMTLLYYLYKNNKWVKVSNEELYTFAKWVAESHPRVKDGVVQAVETFVKEAVIDLKKLE